MNQKQVSGACRALSEAEAEIQRADQLEMQAREKADELAKTVLESPPDERDRAREEAAQAMDELTAAKKALYGAEQAASALVAVFNDLPLLSPRNTSVAMFSEMIRNPARLQACVGLREVQVGKDEHLKKLEEAADVARSRSYEARLLSRSAVQGGVAAPESGRVDLSGSPDRAAATILTALGAEEEAIGTQLQLTLNLASAAGSFAPDQSPLARDLFLRLLLPLEATEIEKTEKSSTGDSTENIRRFSLILGGSLLDPSDPRRKEHDACYQAAHVFAPPLPQYLSGQASDARRVERQAYFAECARAAANDHRLAYRVAASFVTGGEESQGTRTEIVAGALLYSPSTWLTIEPFGRDFLTGPRQLEYGLGLSTPFDLGAGGGARPWGRFSMDLMVYATEKEGVDTEVYFQVTPTLSVLTTQDTYLTIGLGALLARDDDPGVVITTALSYDLDRLTSTLLQPRTGAMGGNL